MVNNTGSSISISLKNKTIRVNILSIYVFLSLIPIIGTPISGDDIPNSQIRKTLQDSGFNLFEFSINTSLQWIKNEGRFFPLSFFWQYATFFVFNQNIFIYKVFLAILYLSCISIISFFILKILNLYNFIIYFIIFIFASNYQIQQSSTMAFDGITGFVGLPIFGLSLFFGGIQLILNSNKKRFEVLGSILIYLSLITYETIFLFLSSYFIFILFILKKSKKLTFILPFSIQGITIVLLRYFIFPNHSDAYTVSLNWKKLFNAYLNNLYSSIPGYKLFTFYQNSITLITIIIILLLSFFIFLIIYSFQKELSYKMNDKYSKIYYLLVTAVISLLISPLGSSLSKRWQNSTPEYHSYISVVYQYINVSVILVCVLLLISKSKIFSILVFYLVSLFASLNFVQNYITVLNL